MLARLSLINTSILNVFSTKKKFPIQILQSKKTNYVCNDAKRIHNPFHAVKIKHNTK